MNNGIIFKRFLGEKPSHFKVIGLAVLNYKPNLMSGTELLRMDMRLGSAEKPIDLSPFLAELTTLKI